MKTAAIRIAAEGALRTGRRFPATIAAALIATGLAILQAGQSPPPWIAHGLGAAILGFPLLAALELAAERWETSNWARFGLSLVGFLLMLAFAVGAQTAPTERTWTRFIHLALGYHLLVASLPVALAAGSNGFWQFNRILFQRALLAVLYSAVLFLGLAIALVALDRLLGISVPNRTYPRLFTTVALLFNTWFFLAGVPTDWEELERRNEYPLPLKVFAQYLLLPLVSVYLGILLLYLGRVVVTRTWPSGWIGYLVSSVALTGTFALLLVHPVRHRPDERWVNTYARWFFVTMLPPLAMLLLAIGKRIGQYGVTEPRYALLVLALWFSGVALFYALTGARTIRPIPVALGLVCLITTFGPWGIFGVSLRSQSARFAAIRAQPARGDTRDRELFEIVEYLEHRHGLAAVAAAVGVPADSTGIWVRTASIDTAMKRIGVDRSMADRQPLRVFNAASASSADGMEIAPGLWLFADRTLFSRATIRFEGDTLDLHPIAAAGVLEIRRRDSLLTAFDLGAALAPVLVAPSEPATYGPVVLDRVGGGLSIRLVIDHAQWYVAAADSLSRSASGSLIIRRQ